MKLRRSFFLYIIIPFAHSIENQFSSVTQSCMTLWDPMDCNIPGLLSITNPGICSNSCPSSQWCHQTLSSSFVPFYSCLQSFAAPGSFLRSQFFASGGQSVGASASVLPMYIQDWFPWGLTGWISLQSRDFQEPSPAPQCKSINSSVLSLHYGPTLTSIHDHWKNHSIDQAELCWQSNVSAF